MTYTCILTQKAPAMISRCLSFWLLILSLTGCVGSGRHTPDDMNIEDGICGVRWGVTPAGLKNVHPEVERGETPGNANNYHINGRIELFGVKCPFVSFSFNQRNQFDSVLIGLWDEKQTRNLKERFTGVHLLEFHHITHENGKLRTEWWRRNTVEVAFTPFPGTIIVSNMALDNNYP